MSFCTITPTRGDRPELLEFCKHQLSRMSNKPQRSYLINYPPTGPNIDLVERVKEGINQAQRDGFDRCFIVEDDDFYPKDYFDYIPQDADFIGDRKTIYYNLRNRSYQDWDHPKRASLFTTGFKISALATFDWPTEEERFLDLAIWRYAVNQRKTMVFRETAAIGIKHGIGLCGGKGHVQHNKYQDKELEWLKQNVDSEAYIFYSTLKV
jgi:hypothetical protein